ncbi:Hypothetical protein CpP54B96_1244 [Corynebacterium pseudotuberculosis P54B96]|nr:Hypothetical protein CpP54B96_1244 [Corynebacterium pseudotuberculosis P54B96]
MVDRENLGLKSLDFSADYGNENNVICFIGGKHGNPDSRREVP